MMGVWKPVGRHHDSLAGVSASAPCRTKIDGQEDSRHKPVAKVVWMPGSTPPSGRHQLGAPLRLDKVKVWAGGVSRTRINVRRPGGRRDSLFGLLCFLNESLSLLDTLKM